MIHLKFSESLETLFDFAETALDTLWTDPFNSPTIVFPDTKMEMWFRYKYAAKNPGKVLANLKALTLDKFLWKSLEPAKNIFQLNAPIIQNVLCAFLVKKWNDGTLNTEFPDVAHYLKAHSKNENAHSESRIDYAKLYDFTASISKLFLEYELSRPAGFLEDCTKNQHAHNIEKGFLEFWNEKNPKDFFFNKKGEISPKEKWQRKLYSAIFHEQNGKPSLLTDAFKKRMQAKFPNATDDFDEKFWTLSYLYAQNKDALKAKLKGQNIILFGLAGIGQFYRVILQEIAKESEFFVFVQNPCSVFWEDVANRKVKNFKSEKNLQSDASENDLLKLWGRSGRENIRLWCTANEYDFEFERKKKLENTALHRVQEAILNRETAPKITEEDDSLVILSAPSKLREVEALHSEVCALLKNKNARLDEMLVLSPILDEYRTEIEMVFNHDEYFDIYEKKVRSPLVYTIADYSELNSSLEAALKILLSMRKNGSYARSDFFDLVNNSAVKNALNISQDAIDSFEQWTLNLNLYRGKKDEDFPNDWRFGIKRLLLARMMNTHFALENENETAKIKNIHPYKDLLTSDTEILEKFISIIDDLNEWVARDSIVRYYPNSETSDIAEIHRILKKFLYSTANTEELLRYKEVRKALHLLDWQFYAGRTEFDFSEIAFALLSSCKGLSGGAGKLFAGLTFMKFTTNRTLPAKYVFILGMNAKTFPGRNSENTLDLRKWAEPWAGDDDTIAKNRYTFLCELMNAGEKFYISYVNKDLKKDEDLSCSGTVQDLINFVKKGNAKILEKKIPLDETRDRSELWTKRALRIKGNSQEKEGKENFEVKDCILKLPEKISGYQLKNFLKNPFIFQVERALGKQEDSSEVLQNFEPIELDALENSSINKEMWNKFATKDVADEKDADFQNFIQELKDQGRFPVKIFGERTTQRMLKMLKQEQKLFKEAQSTTLNKYLSEIEFTKNTKILTYPFSLTKDGQKYETEIEVKTPYLYCENDNVVMYDLTTSSVDKGKVSREYFIAPYLYSLILTLTSKQDKPINFEVFIIPGKEEKDAKNAPSEATSTTYTLDETFAKSFLEKLIERAFLTNYKKMLPVDNILKKSDIPDEFDKLHSNKFYSSAIYEYEGEDLFENSDFGFALNRELKEQILEELFGKNYTKISNVEDIDESAFAYFYKKISREQLQEILNKKEENGKKGA